MENIFRQLMARKMNDKSFSPFASALSLEIFYFKLTSVSTLITSLNLNLRAVSASSFEVHLVGHNLLRF